MLFFAGRCICIMQMPQTRRGCWSH